MSLLVTNSNITNFIPIALKFLLLETVLVSPVELLFSYTIRFLQTYNFVIGVIIETLRNHP
jgi:hypothetical protein